MGADLYRNGKFDERKAKWCSVFEKFVEQRNKANQEHNKPEADRLQKKVEWAYGMMYPHSVYFRDSYNASSVLAQMNLSWWKDVIPLLDEERNLAGDNLKKVIKMVVQGRIPPADKLDLTYAAETDTPEGLEKWRKYFIRKRKNLLRFLRSAYNEGGSIHCSL